MVRGFIALNLLRFGTEGARQVALTHTGDYSRLYEHGMQLLKRAGLGDGDLSSLEHSIVLDISPQFGDLTLECIDFRFPYPAVWPQFLIRKMKVRRVLPHCQPY